MAVPVAPITGTEARFWAEFNFRCECGNVLEDVVDAACRSTFRVAKEHGWGHRWEQDEDVTWICPDCVKG